MAEQNIVQLKYSNNWESHEYRACGKLISQMKHVFVKDPTLGGLKKLKVVGKEVGVQYSDMGHTYTATSMHYFIPMEILGVKVEYPLVELISKKPKVFFVDMKAVKFDE